MPSYLPSKPEPKPPKGGFRFVWGQIAALHDHSSPFAYRL